MNFVGHDKISSGGDAKLSKGESIVSLCTWWYYLLNMANLCMTLAKFEATCIFGVNLWAIVILVVATAMGMWGKEKYLHTPTSMLGDIASWAWRICAQCWLSLRQRAKIGWICGLARLLAVAAAMGWWGSRESGAYIENWENDTKE